MLMFGGAAPTTASETQTYRYDALGRLTLVQTQNGPNNGTQISVEFDPAGNRKRYQVANGASAGGCVLTASLDYSDNDEFTIYPFVERVGDCGSPIGVAYTVESAASGAVYGNAAWFGQSGPIQPSESNPARRSIRVWSGGYGSVAAGNPLVLRVTWRVTSGNASFSRASSLVTFYNSDCGC
ncbi:MAG: hypothetical protein K2X76_01760 [Sphingomonas sp.]|nr:hypothetical protein [Sphingomonas sp.]